MRISPTCSGSSSTWTRWRPPAARGLQCEKRRLGRGNGLRDRPLKRGTRRDRSPRYRLTTGNRTTDGYSAEWWIALFATTGSVSLHTGAPVFRLRVKRGKLELDTSMRMRCPGAKKLLVERGPSAIS